MITYKQLSFYRHFYASTGRIRICPFVGFHITENLFEHLVDLTEPLCKSIDEAKSDMLLFDTSGIEAWATEDKSLADAQALMPTLDDFFKKHPLINPSTFLSDSAFDSVSIYKYLNFPSTNHEIMLG